MEFFQTLERRASLLFFLVLGLSLFLPQAGSYLDFFVYPGLGLMLFSSFLKIDLRELKNQSKSLYLIGAFVFIFQILIPVCIYLSLKHFNQDLATGAFLLTAVPSGLACTVVTNLLKGNGALSLSLTLFTQFFAPVSIPVLAWILLDSNLDLNVSEMCRNIFLIILIPSLLAQWFRHHYLKFTQKIEPALSGFSVLVMLIFAYAVISVQAEFIKSGAFLSFKYLAWNYAIYILLILSGYFLFFKKPKKDRIALLSSAGFMNNGLGIALAYSFFNPNVILFMVLSEIPWITLIGPVRFFLKFTNSSKSLS